LLGFACWICLVLLSACLKVFAYPDFAYQCLLLLAVFTKKIPVPHFAFFPDNVFCFLCLPMIGCLSPLTHDVPSNKSKHIISHSFDVFLHILQRQQ
jgi:hypothetical protein